MPKLFKNIIVAVFIILSIFFLIIGTKDVIASVQVAIMLWSTKIFPVLFPFYIFSSLAIKYGVAEFIGNLIYPVIKRVFNTSKISGFVFIMSLISGNPSSAIIISQLYEEGSLSKKEAQHLLSFCVFVNPLFCIGTIGYAYFQNASIGLIVLISHISANIIIGILLRNNLKGNINISYNKVSKINKPNFGETLTNILQSGINTMFLIAGFMIFYNIVIVMVIYSNVLDYLYQSLSFIIHTMHLDWGVFQSFIIGIMEMVLGIEKVVNSTLPLRTSITVITMLISFGGFSIHSQIQSILIKVKLKYLPFLLSRLAQMIISGLIAYYLFPILYKEKAIDTSYIDYYPLNQKKMLLIIIFLLTIILIITLLYNKKRKEGKIINEK